MPPSLLWSVTITANTGIKEFSSTSSIIPIRSVVHVHIPSGWGLKFMVVLNPQPCNLHVLTLFMPNPDLYTCFYLYFKVQHQFKNQFKNRLCLFLFNQQPFLCPKTPGINLCFAQKSLTLTLIMSQKATMQIISAFSLCLLLDLITFGLKFITRLSQGGQLFPVCCSPREQTPCFSLGHIQLFSGSNSINAGTEENPGKHLLTGEEKGRAGYALLVCWSKRLVILSTEITSEQFLTFQIWA